jgi:hypothetical protein
MLVNRPSNENSMAFQLLDVLMTLLLARTEHDNHESVDNTAGEIYIRPKQSSNYYHLFFS